jgi:hypothetical protein
LARVSPTDLNSFSHELRVVQLENGQGLAHSHERIKKVCG